MASRNLRGNESGQCLVSSIFSSYVRHPLAFVRGLTFHSAGRFEATDQEVSGIFTV